MSIKYQWQAAKNEFGNHAFKRFNSGAFMLDSNNAIENMFSVILHDDENDNDDYLCFKPLRELWAHDDDFYIDAFKMWEISLADKNKFFNAKNNDDIFDALNSVNYDCRRKDSAGLPFDLERAKAGGVVERLDLTGKWVVETSWFHTAFIHNGIVVYGERKLSAKISDLRMKYPPQKTA